MSPKPKQVLHGNEGGKRDVGLRSSSQSHRHHAAARSSKSPGSGSVVRSQRTARRSPTTHASAKTTKQRNERRNATVRAKCVKEASRATAAAKQRRRANVVGGGGRKTTTKANTKTKTKKRMTGGGSDDAHNDDEGDEDDFEGTLLAVLEVGVFIIEVWSPHDQHSIEQPAAMTENDVVDAECWVYHHDFGDDVVSVVPFYVLHKALFDAALRSSVVVMPRIAANTREEEKEDDNDDEETEESSGDMFHAAFSVVSTSFPALKSLILYGTTAAADEDENVDADYYNAQQSSGDEEEDYDTYEGSFAVGIHPLDVFDVLTYLVLWQRMSYPAVQKNSSSTPLGGELYADRDLIDSIIEQREYQSVEELSNELDELELQAASLSRPPRRGQFQDRIDSSFVSPPLVFLPYPRIDDNM